MIICNLSFLFVFFDENQKISHELTICIAKTNPNLKVRCSESAKCIFRTLFSTFARLFMI